MALDTNKENVMSAISTLGFEVFRSGQFHWNSSDTPDMFINEDGTIHCWTISPFKNYTQNHGDLIDFLMIDRKMNFIEAKAESYKLLNLPMPLLESYKDNGYSPTSIKKEGFIPEEFILAFEEQRKLNFIRYKELLNQALPSLNFPQQKIIAQNYQIGYIEQSDRLSMPIRNEFGDILTLWKYNKTPKPYTNSQGIEVKPNKVLFTKGRARCPFNLTDLLKYREDKNGWIFLCGGEKDVLNMVGNGYRAITLGAENMDIDEKYLPLFKDLKIIVAYDYDKAGFEGTQKMLAQLECVAETVKTWDWDLLALQENIELFKGFDLTDWLCKKNKEFL
jgi:DNA primase